MFSSLIRTHYNTADKLTKMFNEIVPAPTPIDSNWPVGVKNWHVQVYARMNKCFTDILRYWKFITLNMTEAQAKRYPKENWGPGSQHGMLRHLMEILDKDTRYEFSSFYLSLITEEVMKTVRSVEEWVRIMMKTNQEICEKARLFSEFEADVDKPPNAKEQAQKVRQQSMQRKFLAGQSSAGPPSRASSGGSGSRGFEPQGYSRGSRPTGRYPKSNTIRVLFEDKEESFTNDMDISMADSEDNFYSMEAVYPEFQLEDDVAYECGDVMEFDSKLQALQQFGGYKKGPIPSTPPKRFEKPGTPLRKPGSSNLPCFLKYETGHCCNGAACPYQHNEKDMEDFTDNSLRRLLKSPFCGLAKLIEKAQRLDRLARPYDASKSGTSRPTYNKALDSTHDLESSLHVASVADDGAEDDSFHQS